MKINAELVLALRAKPACQSDKMIAILEREKIT
jgi:hypothetical protein